MEKVIINNLLNGYGKDKDKYIVHRPNDYSGFGNQVQSLVGNMATALATGRRFRSKIFKIAVTS